MRHAAVVAMVGETSSEAHLPEVALEHEISVARRTSRYATGTARSWSSAGSCRRRGG
jgi:hypothetical protein